MMDSFDSPANLRELLTAARFIPVLTLKETKDAVPVVRALVDGGLNVVELTLRTDVVEESLPQIRHEVPEATVGVGTVRSAKDISRVERMAPDFAVSPGLTESLLDAARRSRIPFLPGVATASELLRAVDHGFQTLKFFPAEAAGGPAALKSLAGPFPDVAFCPTGGILEDDIGSYLSLPSVIAVGASWIAADEHVRNGNWPEITKRAAAVRCLVDKFEQ